MSPRVWLYQVPDTSFPVSSFGLSSPFSRLLAKSLKVSHWPRPPVPPPQNLKTLGVWRFCPGPQCACTLLALHAPWSTDFTQCYKQCSLLLCMHTHMHIHAHRDPEHMHTCVCTCTYWSVYTHTHTHTHTPAHQSNATVPHCHSREAGSLGTRRHALCLCVSGHHNPSVEWLCWGNSPPMTLCL